MAYRRLNPETMTRERQQDRIRTRQSRRQSRTPRLGDWDERKRRAALVVEMIRAGFRALAKKHHPDVGGAGADMAALAATRD